MPKLTSRFAAVLAVALVAAAFALNPSPERHRDQVKASISERSPLAGMLGMGAFAAFLSTYHSYGVLSYTTVDGRLLSIGSLGFVVVLQPELKRS